MKIKEGFIISEISDYHVVIPVGNNIADHNAMITLSETGAFLWHLLQSNITTEALVSALCAEYDIDNETASRDVAEFIETLQASKLVE